MSVPTYSPSNRIVHETHVDLVGRYISEPVHVVQGDHELPVVAVKLFANGVRKSISDILGSATSSEINVRCRDKNFNTVYMSVLGINISGDTLYFEVTDSMTKTPGYVEVVIEIKCDDQIAQTSRVILDVDRNPIQKVEEPPIVAGFTMIMNMETRDKFSVMNTPITEEDYIIEEAG